MTIGPEPPTREGGEADSTGDVLLDVIAARKPDPSRSIATRVRSSPDARTRWRRRGPVADGDHHDHP